MWWKWRVDWFPWKLSCVSALGGLADTVGLILINKLICLYSFHWRSAGFFYWPEPFKVGFFTGGCGHGGNIQLQHWRRRGSGQEESQFGLLSSWPFTPNNLVFHKGPIVVSSNQNGYLKIVLAGNRVCQLQSMQVRKALDGGSY